ncbi:MAG: hypothetical protein ACREFX_08820 [Opitutaceae bacterium]
MGTALIWAFLSWASPIFPQEVAAPHDSPPHTTISFDRTSAAIAAGNRVGNAAMVRSEPPTSESVLPYGNVLPPNGRTWVVTANDTFAQDSSIDTSLWNGGSGGGVWWCHSGNGDYSDDLGHSGPLNTVDNGGQFYGTPSIAPYVTVVKGTGLVVQDFNKPGSDLTDERQSWMGLTNYGHFLQKFGYFEWCAKMPDESNGAADGLHTDLWCTPEGRNQVNQSAEVDVNEAVWGSGVTKAHFCIWENTPGVPPPHGNFLYGVSGSFSSAFHIFGLYWRNDGLGAYGSMQLYVDGRPQGSPAPLNDPAWNSGVYCFAGWMQQANWHDRSTGGGPIDSKTSNDNPLYVRWWRAWQFQNSSAAPTISGFLAHPSTITSGSSTILTWTTSGATSLSLDHGKGAVTGRNQVTVRPPATTAYTLTAANGKGPVTRTVTVTVNPPNGNLIADPGFELQPLPNGDMLQPPWYGVGSDLIGVYKTAAECHSGRNCAYITSDGKNNNFWDAIAQTVSVTPYTDYVLTGWVSDSSGSTFAGGEFGVRTNAGVVQQTSIPKIDSYTRLKVSFNSGSKTSLVVYAGFAPTGAGAWLHLDDVSLTSGDEHHFGRVPRNEGTSHGYRGAKDK